MQYLRARALEMQTTRGKCAQQNYCTRPITSEKNKNRRSVLYEPRYRRKAISFSNFRMLAMCTRNSRILMKPARCAGYIKLHVSASSGKLNECDFSINRNKPIGGNCSASDLRSSLRNVASVRTRQIFLPNLLPRHEESI